MIESISASLAVGDAQASTRVKAPVAQASINPAEDKQNSPADGFRDALARAHDEIAKSNFNSPGTPAVAADPVAQQASQMLPSPWKGPVENAAASNAPPPSAATEANGVLRQSFDHAIAVTLISQVVGGLSQTTSTLIRQQ
jgi:hypothetical protein